MSRFILMLFAVGLFVVGLFAGAAPVPIDNDPPTAVLEDRSPGDHKGANLQFLQEQVKLLTSRPVLTVAFRKPAVCRVLPLDFEGDEVKWLQERLQVQIQPEQGRIRVWLRSGTRREQAAALNALVGVYLEEEGKQRRKWPERHLQMLERAQQSDRKELEARTKHHFGRPPALRDPSDERRIRLLKEDIERDAKKLEEVRSELRVPSRITVLEKARVR